MTAPPLAVPPRRAVLRAFIASVAISAFVGVGIVIAGDSSDFVVRAFVSSLTVSGASLVALCGAAHFEAKGDRFPAVPTIAAAALALVLTNVGIWGDVSGEEFWQLVMTAWIAGAVGAHTALLGFARLAPRHLVVAGATDLVIYLLGLTATIMIWGDVHSELGARTLGVLSILAAAGTLTIPVLHRMNKDDVARAAEADPGASVAMLCPVCGAPHEAPLGRVECPSCSAVFRVELVTPVEECAPDGSGRWT